MIEKEAGVLDWSARRLGFKDAGEFGHYFKETFNPKSGTNRVNRLRAVETVADGAQLLKNRKRWQEAGNWAENATEDELLNPDNFDKINAVYEASQNKIARSIAGKGGKQSVDKQLERLQALRRYVTSGGHKWDRNGYAKAMSELKAMRTAGGWLSDNADNEEAMLSDEGIAHAKTVSNALNSSNKKQLAALGILAPTATNSLNENKGKIQMLANNGGVLRSMYQLKKNPLMWFLKSFFSSNPTNFYKTVGALHTAATDKGSDWHQFIGKDLDAYKNYMPWMRLAHNVRGVMGGDQNFKPITYAG